MELPSQLRIRQTVMSAVKAIPREGTVLTRGLWEGLIWEVAVELDFEIGGELGLSWRWRVDMPSERSSMNKGS